MVLGHVNPKDRQLAWEAGWKTMILKNFETCVQSVHKQLEDINKTPPKQIERFLRWGKNIKRIQSLQETIESLERSEIVLLHHIST